MADCIRNKIDSNVTGLSFAEEVCSGQLPTIADDGYDPIWYDQEPNEYDEFGAEIETVARQPISRTRQNKKGTTVGVDATGGYNQDHTANNHDRLLQGFFFADIREKPSTYPINGDKIDITAVTTASDRFEASGNGLENRGFLPGMLVKAEGFTNATNNGVHLIDEVEDGYIGVTTDLTNEAAPPAAAMLSVVGYEFVAADASITMSSSIPTLVLATAVVAADATLTITVGQNAIADETVTIGSLTYTFKAAAANAFEVTIGADRLETLTNLAATINGSAAATPAHSLVTATANGDGTMDIDAIIPGTGGNGIDTAETLTDGSWDGATAGGSGFSFQSLGVVEGEWVYLGAAGNTFVNNGGFARIAVGGLTDLGLTFDKTTWDAQAEAGAGLTIRLFIGQHLRNEPDADDVVTRYFQFERTLGDDDDGTQAEYLIGAVANELTLNTPVRDKITFDLGFIAADAETRTGAEALKDGDHVAALGEDAYNTGSDLVRMRLGVIDTDDSNPASLFAYATEAELTITNNVDPINVLGRLGALDVSVGNFEVSGEITALFVSVLAIRAIRQNSDVTFDMIAAKQNGGFVFDMPLLSLGGGRPDIELNQPVTIPLEAMGAESDFGTTLSYTHFLYLPDVAMPEGAN